MTKAQIKQCLINSMIVADKIEQKSNDLSLLHFGDVVYELCDDLLDIISNKGVRYFRAYMKLYDPVRVYASWYPEDELSDAVKQRLWKAFRTLQVNL